jgi:putative component of membrane protein insertase Oxa1/YidC/SpoIIIJ protein YidD
MHILVVEVAVDSLQLLLTAVTFTKCHHSLTCSHCTEFWCHVLAVTSSSAERTLSCVRIIKN